MDELDQMVTKKQDVIYNFFNWPHMAHSKLIVIAIANTMDLPERELSGKIRSRLGLFLPCPLRLSSQRILMYDASVRLKSDQFQNLQHTSARRDFARST